MNARNKSIGMSHEYLSEVIVFPAYSILVFYSNGWFFYQINRKVMFLRGVAEACISTARRIPKSIGDFE